MLYSYNTGDKGLIMMNTNSKLVKAFSEVYSKQPKLRIIVLPGFVESSGLVMVAMLHLMSWSIDGWYTLPEFRKNTELWNLMIRAQGEILGLSRYGWTGRLMAMWFGSWVTWKLMVAPMEAALPLQLHEFNAFHHGSKAVKQDLMTLDDLIAEGEKEKHKMPALREVIKRAREKVTQV